MINFQPNTTYSTRSACDHDCIFRVTVTRVSDKSVWFIHPHTGNEKRAAIQHYGDDAPFFFPFGRYSMAPIMRADRKA